MSAIAALKHLAEVPEHRREHGALLVDRRRVPDHVDEPDLLAGGLDGLDVAERRTVAHAEDDVGARGDGGLHDALAAGGVVVGRLPDLGEGELHVRVDAARAGHEAARLLEPVRVGGRDDDPELVALSLLGREHAGEVGAVLARGLDVGHVVLDQVLRIVVADHRHLRLHGDARSDGVVAAGLGDHELVAAAGEPQQDGLGVVVADAVADGQGRAVDLRGHARTGNALLVPAVIVRLGGRRDRDLGDVRLLRERPRGHARRHPDHQ